MTYSTMGSSDDEGCEGGEVSGQESTQAISTVVENINHRTVSIDITVREILDQVKDHSEKLRQCTQTLSSMQKNMEDLRKVVHGARLGPHLGADGTTSMRQDGNRANEARGGSRSTPIPKLKINEEAKEAADRMRNALPTSCWASAWTRFAIDCLYISATVEERRYTGQRQCGKFLKEILSVDGAGVDFAERASRRTVVLYIRLLQFATTVKARTLEELQETCGDGENLVDTFKQKPAQDLWQRSLFQEQSRCDRIIGEFVALLGQSDSSEPLDSHHVRGVDRELQELVSWYIDSIADGQREKTRRGAGQVQSSLDNITNFTKLVSAAMKENYEPQTIAKGRPGSRAADSMTPCAFTPVLAKRKRRCEGESFMLRVFKKIRSQEKYGLTQVRKAIRKRFWVDIGFVIFRMARKNRPSRRVEELALCSGESPLENVSKAAGDESAIVLQPLTAQDYEKLLSDEFIACAAKDAQAVPVESLVTSRDWNVGEQTGTKMATPIPAKSALDPSWKEHNTAAFGNLIQATPELVLTVKYAVHCQVDKSARGSGFAERAFGEALYVTKQYPLHHLASTILVEIGRLSDTDALMVSHKNSIRAIHVLAVTLRAVVEEAVCRAEKRSVPGHLYGIIGSIRAFAVSRTETGNMSGGALEEHVRCVDEGVQGLALVEHDIYSELDHPRFLGDSQRNEMIRKTTSTKAEFEELRVEQGQAESSAATNSCYRTERDGGIDRSHTTRGDIISDILGAEFDL